MVAIFTTLQSLVAIAWLQPAGAFALISFGTFRLFSRRGHPRWVAMRVNWIQLALWSFLMASAHGAGLMLFPILLGIVPPGGVCGDSIGRRGALMMHAHIQAIAVVLLHVGAMAVVMGAIAILVYEKIGLAILRSAWINLDAIWAAALIGAGVISLVV